MPYLSKKLVGDRLIEARAGGEVAAAFLSSSFFAVGSFDSSAYIDGVPGRTSTSCSRSSLPIRRAEISSSRNIVQPSLSVGRKPRSQPYAWNSGTATSTFVLSVMPSAAIA